MVIILSYATFLRASDVSVGSRNSTTVAGFKALIHRPKYTTVLQYMLPSGPKSWFGTSASTCQQRGTVANYIHATFLRPKEN